MNRGKGAPINRGERNMNPPGMGLWALWREDLRTHDGKLFEQGFWAIAVHRFGNWRMGFPKLLRIPCTLLYRMMFGWVEWTCGITLPYTVKLGRRVRIWHHGGMILHAESIGDDVHIRQNTTFGVAKKDDAAEVAKTGFDAMMRGDGDVVFGMKNKIQSSIANVLPAGVLARQHRKMAEPGSAKS